MTDYVGESFPNVMNPDFLRFVIKSYTSSGVDAWISALTNNPTLVEEYDGTGLSNMSTCYYVAHESIGISGTNRCLLFVWGQDNDGIWRSYFTTAKQNGTYTISSLLESVPTNWDYKVKTPVDTNGNNINPWATVIPKVVLNWFYQVE